MMKNIGLALGSGGGRGLAHIGVIKALEKNKIPINYIAGTSIGSVVGGLYAMSGDIATVEKIAESVNFRKILRIMLKRNPEKTGMFDKTFKLLLGNIVGNTKIEDLKIPFCAVGSNLNTGEAEYMKSGSLMDAMRASTAIPLIRKPVMFEEKYIFDGGLINPIPTKTIRDMGAKTVIGVSLYGGVFPLKNRKKMTALRAGELSRFITLKKLSQIDMEEADIKIELQIPNEDYGVFSQFYSGKKLIDFGYKTTNKIIKNLDFGEISLNKFLKKLGTHEI